MVLVPCTTERSSIVIEHMLRIGIRRRYMDKLGLVRISHGKSIQRKRSQIDENSLSSYSSHDYKRQRVSKDCDSSGRHTTSAWSDVPDELLEVIMKNLTSIKDFIHIGAVCVWWRHAYNSIVLPHFPRQLPLLAVVDRDRCKLSLVSPSSDKSRRTLLFDSDIHISRDSHCICSSEGWLVLTTEDQITPIRLVNPFLNVDNEILLPPHRTRMRKIVLSSNPASISDYVVAGLHDDRGLVFYKPGDTAWSMVQSPHFLDDVIHYKDEFYVVDSTGNLRTGKPSATHFTDPPQNINGANRKYLVESLGDLLLVVRKTDGLDDDEITVGCIVYKMDWSKKVWNMVTSLGGHSLFLGGISSMSVLTTQFRCVSFNLNSVYFGYDLPSSYVWGNGLDTVVINLEDGSIEKVANSYHKTGPIWIEPKLKAHGV